jgi:DNA modification methylase
MSTQPTTENTGKNSALHQALHPALANDSVIETIALELVREAARIVRKISKRAVATTKAILTQWGQVCPIVIDENGTIVAGAEFLIAARELNWKTIKAVRLQALTDADRRVLTIALARIPELSTWDDEILADEISQLLKMELPYDALDTLGFNIPEIDVLFETAADDQQPDPLDDVPRTPTKAETVTRAGDIWLLGKHRIICGNALVAETYARLIGTERIRMLFSDSPYSIPIKGNVSQKHEDFAMGVGEQSSEEFTVFLKTMIVLAIEYLADGGLAYLFMDRRHLFELQLAARDAGLSILDLCIWDKTTGGLGGLYRSQHEPIFVFKHGKAPHTNNVALGKYGRNRTNVWSVRGFASFGKGRDEALSLHPTVKPVNLLAEAIKDCTKRGEIVLDPFLGSGSVVLAAEKTGRVGYGIELEPRYVDAGIFRFQKMTGKSVTLEATGQTFDEVRSERLTARENTSPDNSGNPSLVHTDQ